MNNNDFKELGQKLDEAKNLVNALEIEYIKLKLDNTNKNNIRWRAKEGEEYWALDSAVSLPYRKKDNYSIADNTHFSLGNYFKTEIKTIRYREHLIITQKLKDIALRLNDGVEIDWKNGKEKYCIGLNYQDGKLTQFTLTMFIVKHLGQIYCLSSKFLETAIKEIGEKELIEYIKGS